MNLFPAGSFQVNFLGNSVLGSFSTSTLHSGLNSRHTVFERMRGFCSRIALDFDPISEPLARPFRIVLRSSVFDLFSTYCRQTHQSRNRNCRHVATPARKCATSPRLSEFSSAPAIPAIPAPQIPPHKPSSAATAVAPPSPPGPAIPPRPPSSFLPDTPRKGGVSPPPPPPHKTPPNHSPLSLSPPPPCPAIKKVPVSLPPCPPAKSPHQFRPAPPLPLPAKPFVSPQPHQR